MGASKDIFESYRDFCDCFLFMDGFVVQMRSLRELG